MALGNTRALTGFSEEERMMAISLLDFLITRVGDPAKRQVRADDLHRLICLMSAIVIEGDDYASAKEQLSDMGRSVGILVQMIADDVRSERVRTGVGLLEQALRTEGTYLA